MSARDFPFALDIGIGVALGITAGGAIVLVGWRFFLALSERRLALQRKSKWFRSGFINSVVEELLHSRRLSRRDVKANLPNASVR